ncbi:uncharacterized protein LOC143836617 [Paroedura picta]|uniref:uncharacterized protein LOC143836617 n=1 Tax=Paroedura picta TaxID=143630 RepID=UPI00405642DC
MGPGAFLLLLPLLQLMVLAPKHHLEAAGVRSCPLSSPPAEKAGSCPPGRDQDVPLSRRFCLDDASCPGSEKCCTVGKMRTCVQPARVAAGYCPTLCPAVEEPCLETCLDDTWCGPGEKCCLNGCHICCVEAQPAKPGVCPRKRVSIAGFPCVDQCVDDRSCPGDKKCCFTGCGLQCLSPPTEPPPACPLDRSEPAGHLGSEAKQCQGAGCSQDPARTSLVKPGACPVLLRGSLGPCPEAALKKNCSHDLDCEEAKKCCWTGCQHVCAMPDEVHPGTCPPRAAEINASECVTFCVRDKDCPKSQKCCWLRCGRSCIAPAPGGGQARGNQDLQGTRGEEPGLGLAGLPTTEPAQRGAKKPKTPSEEKEPARIPTVKPGQCEPSAGRCQPGTDVTYECKTDGDCSGTMKCCPDGCSQKCAPPQKG